MIPENPSSSAHQSADGGSLTIDSGSVGDAFGCWHDISRPLFEVMPRQDIADFRSTSAFGRVSGIVFAQNAFSACRFIRDERRVRTAETDFITLHLPLSGEERGIVDDVEQWMKPGRITLQDWATPFSMASESVEKMGLIIPRERIKHREWVRLHRPVLHWDLAQRSGRDLLSPWRQAWQVLSTGKVDAAKVYADELIETINRLVDDARSERSGAEHRDIGGEDFRNIKRFIDEHLDDPALGPEMLSQALRCSRSTLFRRFNMPGGIKGYIQDQRLAHCYSALTSDQASFNFIYELAQRWGFDQTSYFNRLFKRRFGKSPIDVQRNAHAGSRQPCQSSDAPKIAIYHQWLRNTTGERPSI